MKPLHTCIFTISFVFTTFFSGFSQEKEDEIAEQLPDSIAYKEKFGLRVGVDISKLIRSIIEDGYTGFEVVGDYQIIKNYFLAAELGNENYDYTEPYLDVNTQGSYAKIGANYNTYKNWVGMQNEIYVGVRYGFSTFSQQLNNYTIYTTDNYFPADTREVNQEFNGLTASWAELQIGLKTEVLNNLFLGLHIQLKTKIAENTPDNFGNLYIPGFHRTYDNGNTGVGWGYSVSYLIPIIKKERKQKVNKP